MLFQDKPRSPHPFIGVSMSHKMVRERLIVRFPHLGKHKICLNKEKIKELEELIKNAY